MYTHHWAHSFDGVSFTYVQIVEMDFKIATEPASSSQGAWIPNQNHTTSVVWWWYAYAALRIANKHDRKKKLCLCDSSHNRAARLLGAINWAEHVCKIRWMDLVYAPHSHNKADKRSNCSGSRDYLSIPTWAQMTLNITYDSK